MGEEEKCMKNVDELWSRERSDDIKGRRDFRKNW
jgi:hypothetical protein